MLNFPPGAASACEVALKIRRIRLRAIGSKWGKSDRTHGGNAVHRFIAERFVRPLRQMASLLIQSHMMFAFGILDQLILSGSSFILTSIVAHGLGAADFGRFSIAWSFVMLMEGGMQGVFGDAVPAVAHRLPKARWPQFRSSVIILSTGLTGLLSLLLLIGGGVALVIAPDLAKWFLGIATALIGMRLQNVLRRLCYLDNLRALAAVSAGIYALILALTIFIWFRTAPNNPVGPLFCLTLSSIVAGAYVLKHRRDLDTPTLSLLGWSGLRLWMTGRWLTVSAVMSWMGNLGIIPLAGIMIGFSASGTLRAIQTLVVPMFQLNQVITSIIIPSSAKELRASPTNTGCFIALKSMVLFGIPTMLYSTAATLYGDQVFRTLFGENLLHVTNVIIAVATFGYAAESIKSGLNIVLISAGRTKALFVAQVISLLCAFILLFCLSYSFGILGVVIAMTVANNISTATSVHFFLEFARKRSNASISRL